MTYQVYFEPEAFSQEHAEEQKILKELAEERQPKRCIECGAVLDGFTPINPASNCFCSCRCAMRFRGEFS